MNAMLGRIHSVAGSQIVMEAAIQNDGLHTELALHLQEVDRILADTLQSESNETHQMLAFVRGLSGKKMRPTLTILSALSLGNVNQETIRLAAVVELVHLATLIHDDVLDGAPMRRHLPTVHTKWNTTAAILTGDWLFTKAYQLANMGTSTLPGRWIAGSACRLCEGENLQNQNAGNWELSFDEYHLSLKGKTGELCALSCQLGAWSVGASEESIAALSQFGMKLGVAFQLHDDYLDYFGTQLATGKSPLADLRSRKATLPIIELLAAASPLDRDLILQDLSAEGSSPTPTMRWLEKYRIQHTVQSYIADYARLAAATLLELPSSEPKNALLQLAKIAVSRQA